MRKKIAFVALALVMLVVTLVSHSSVADPVHHRTGAIVLLGDSVAHGAGDESGRGISGNLPRSLNLGINGARTFNVLRLLRSAGAQRAIRAADTVIVSIGGNDLYGDSSARLMTTICPSCSMMFVLPRIDAVVRRLHRINPAARIVLLGLYNPNRGRAFLDRQVNLWDARLIERFAGDRSVDVIRIADLLTAAAAISSIDHFHPSASGYATIAARIAPVL